MSNGFLSKAILIIIYILIIIMIPLFLDYIFRLTVRRKRKSQIKYLAEQQAKKTGKALIIIDNLNHGVVSHKGSLDEENLEEFNGDIVEIIDNMADNSCVIVVLETLEYVDGLRDFIKKVEKVSGGDFYAVNIEKNSPRIFWDYKIKNVMAKSYYTPNTPTSGEIQWTKPNDLQKSIQKFYSYVFKVVPYRFFVSDPNKKIDV